MKYNPNLFNKGVFPRFTSVTVYAKPSYSSDVLYEIKGFAGMTDGNYENVGVCITPHHIDVFFTVFIGIVPESRIDIFPSKRCSSSI